MSDPISALNGAAFQGFASIREIGPLGMISLRAKDVPGLAAAIKAAVGTPVPDRRRIEASGAFACGWMSPDEYLLILPYGQVSQAMTAIATALVGQHHLAVDVSDARAVFRIEGDKAGQVLAKLSPTDLSAMAPHELRRSRVAQVAAAFWAQDGGYTLICFRSVAGYVMALLAHSAQTGSELG